MKRDKYLADLETVTKQAATLSDADKMRDALIEARASFERRYMELKRADFNIRNGDKSKTNA